ncbi:MAG: histidine--tRNA ligase [Candidatus Peregrinibacteria bacterium]|nr:histidine--tRNA ligase [Candidatus Peregrinibacteria bacterium]
MTKSFRAPSGTKDYLPDNHDFFTFVKKVVRHRFRQSGFRRITPPIFEETEAFERSLGISSEIMKKEIYSFEDRHGRTYSLRPEITTGIVRSFIELEMHEEALPKEFYYIEKCFRFERPKTRTEREFHQLGAEILGESDPALDAQIIYLGHRILSDLSIRDACELRINTIGSPEDRQAYLAELENFYASKIRSLSPESREKFEQKKFLELLDPKNEDEEILVKMAPKITDFLSEESKQFFEQMIEYLETFNIEFKIDPSLIRPLEYYSNTTFEFREKNTGEKILVGGRYDGLIKKMGGSDLGGVGFAAGAGRIIDLMKNQGIDVPHKDYLQIFVAATGPIAKKEALPILIKLREHGFHAVGVLGRTSMQEQMERAKKFHVPYMILMGDIEIKKKEVIVRDMESGRQEWISIDNIMSHMDKLLGSPHSLDTTTDFLGHE